VTECRRSGSYVVVVSLTSDASDRTLGQPAVTTSYLPTAVTLRAGQAAHLAGYLSGLMEGRRALPQGRGRHVVSIISGEPDFPPQRALVEGFSAGVRRPGSRLWPTFRAWTDCD
jgi:hypothetical protein